MNAHHPKTDGTDMQTAPTIGPARAFANHRDLVAAIVPLKDAGKIEAYSIHKHPSGGYAAGVCVGETWVYLA